MHRCVADGAEHVQKEVEMILTFRSYKKSLFADILINHGAMFELKVTDSIVAAYKSQLLNYMFVCGLEHGKVVNMGATSVQDERVLTSITQQERRPFDVIDNSTTNHHLHDLLRELFLDWGVFLSPHLYADAALSLLGCDHNPRRIDMISDGRTIGTVGARLIAPDIALSSSSVTDLPKRHEKHLLRLLRHIPLRAIEWIDLAHHETSFKTLT